MSFSNNQFCTEPSYRGLHVQSQTGPLIVPYLDSQLRLYEFLLYHWSLVYGFRFDLHFPSGCYEWDSSVVSSFIDSLNAKIKNVGKEFTRAGWDIKPRTIWAKEQRFSLNYHYHFAVLLNGHFMNDSGSIYKPGWSLRKAIVEAWAQALGLSLEQAYPLVEFCENGDYLVDRDSGDFLQQFTNLFYRTSYFAKWDSKSFGDGTQNHRCSQVPTGFNEFDLDEHVRCHKENLWSLGEYGYLPVSGWF
jgi:hypothetical protein